MDDWYWHVHHDILVERLIAPVQERIDFIMKNKPKDEIEARLRLLKPVNDQNTLTVAGKARDEARAAARKAYDEDEARAAARKAYDEDEAAARAYKAMAPARKARDEAWKAYYEAEVMVLEAYDEAETVARKVYDEAVSRLHKKECYDCPWDGQTIFPVLREGQQ